MVNVTRDAASFFENEQYPYFIYGCTNLARHLGNLMERCGLKLYGYLDWNESAWGSNYYGHKVYPRKKITDVVDCPVYNIILTMNDIKSVLLDFWEMDRTYNILIPSQFSSGKFINNLLLAPLRNRLLKNKDITVISNNCSDKLIYEAIGIPPKNRSPFSNNAMNHEDYLKLVKNVQYYIEQELELDSYEYKGITIDKSDVYPVGRLGDIKIHFAHSSEWEKIKGIWEKRKNNIYLDSMFWIFSDYRRPILYPVAKEFSQLNVNKCIQLSECMYYLPGVNYATEKNGTFLDEDSIIEDWFDLLGWLNGEYTFC